MSKQNKQGVALLATLVIGFTFGLLFAPPETVTVEKPVEVEKVVEKPVEVETQECRDTRHNYEVAQKVIDVKDKAILISSEIFGDMEYYLTDSNALMGRVNEMEGLVKELDALEAQYK